MTLENQFADSHFFLAMDIQSIIPLSINMQFITIREAQSEQDFLKVFLVFLFNLKLFRH